MCQFDSCCHLQSVYIDKQERSYTVFSLKTGHLTGCTISSCLLKMVFCFNFCCLNYWIVTDVMDSQICKKNCIEDVTQMLAVYPISADTREMQMEFSFNLLGILCSRYMKLTLYEKVVFLCLSPQLLNRFSWNFILGIYIKSCKMILVLFHISVKIFTRSSYQILSWFWEWFIA